MGGARLLFFFLFFILRTCSTATTLISVRFSLGLLFNIEKNEQLESYTREIHGVIQCRLLRTKGSGAM